MDEMFISDLEDSEDMEEREQPVETCICNCEAI